ncbi:peroxisomal membrane protein 11D-like isoform X1 [Hibiscus syriacus]|uniref:Peroxisomal membrane protein 11D-like isoform X1 n=1 Tax=Hibiscus syriacus TaxID=106335 RepID=A0A6A3A9D6_HIBSY|nr:peroxisomal membrane protein 11D-like isoform X1 [Hibiscus syriacus]
MGEDTGNGISDDTRSAEELLSYAKELVPMALVQAREVVFPVRLKMIISKVEQIPWLLSDLSSHPFFSKYALCKEKSQFVSKTLKGATELADSCLKEKFEGKLKMQSDLDALSGKMDLNLRDIGLLIENGVLGEATLPLSSVGSSPEFGTAAHCHLKEVLARLQIGHLESKHKAVDSLVEVMKADEKSALTAMGRSNVAALVQLLTATLPPIREKAATVICSLVESGSCESWLVSEGVLPTLIRLIESSNKVGREKRLRFTGCSCLYVKEHISCSRESNSQQLVSEKVCHLQGGIQSLLAYLDGPFPQESPVAALRNLVGLVSTEVLTSLDFLLRLVHEPMKWRRSTSSTRGIPQSTILPIPIAGNSAAGHF